MATEVYKINYVFTVDGQPLEISPLKIKYLKEFMDIFSHIKDTKNDDEAINLLSDCVRVAMKQFSPELSTSIGLVQDNFDIKTIYKIINYAANIKINESVPAEVANAQQQKGSSWDELDLAKLESEVFTLGIWKNYDELEKSLCMDELMLILSTTRDLNYEEKKFMAALKGIDLDSQNGGNNSGEVKGQQEWENLKARVFSKGKATDSNDILSLQGPAAKKAGFGIGMGLDYEDLRNS
jgi:hypothetical protein